jgi:hypothetical protein
LTIICFLFYRSDNIIECCILQEIYQSFTCLVKYVSLYFLNQVLQINLQILTFALISS